MLRHHFLTALTLTALALPATAQTPLEVALAEQLELAAARPGDPAVLNDLGNLQAALGDAESARASYHQALAIDADNIAARYNLAVLLHATGRPREAKRQLESVLKAEPGHAWAHYQYGAIQAKRGKKKAAVKHYAHAFRLEPRLTEPAFNPHVVGNPLKTRAMVLSYKLGRIHYTSPATYAEPERIAALLVRAEAEQRQAMSQEAPADATAEGEQEPASDAEEAEGVEAGEGATDAAEENEEEDENEEDEEDGDGDDEEDDSDDG